MIRKTLLVLTALSLTSTAALAMPNGVTLSKDGRSVTVAHGIASYVMHAPKKSKPVIFSNIGYDYPKGLYFCCYGGTISGPKSELDEQVWDAVAFTPSKSGTVSEVEVGVGYFAGTNGVNIGVYSDSGGVPGTSLYSKDVTGLPNGGGCCTTQTLKVKGVSVTAGTQYWVVISTDSNNDDFFGFWNYNSTDQVDPVTEAQNDGTSWSSFSGVPAFNVTVYGK
jgi:hypothetical protein